MVQSATLKREEFAGFFSQFVKEHKQNKTLLIWFEWRTK